MNREKAAAFDALMRNAVNILKGPDDPRIKEITAYMRKYKANIDAGRKVKPSEYADEKIRQRLLRLDASIGGFDA
jgi:hypothetical protein